jgi:hypothetical protein
MRLRTPLAALALCALAAPAALAPTPAAAVINQSTSGCAAPHPGDQVFWNGNTWCQLQEGQGGAPSSAPGASPLDPHFWASSDAPKDPVVECLRQNAGACMPVQRGGPGSRGVLEGKEGPIAGQGGNGSKAAGKSETAKGQGKPKLSRGDCKKMRETGSFAPQILEELVRLQAQLADLDRKHRGYQKIIDEQRWWVRKYDSDRPWPSRFFAAPRQPLFSELDRYSYLTREMHYYEQYAQRVEAMDKPGLERIATLQAEVLRVLSGAAHITKLALGECDQLYGK